jgi:hypothetical protein
VLSCLESISSFLSALSTPAIGFCSLELLGVFIGHGRRDLSRQSSDVHLLGAAVPITVIRTQHSVLILEAPRQIVMLLDRLERHPFASALVEAPVKLSTARLAMTHCVTSSASTRMISSSSLRAT